MKTEKKSYVITQNSLIMRALAGGYLLYLVYRMITGWQESTGLTLVLSVAGIIIFAVMGVFFLVHSLYSLSTGRYAGGALDIPAQEHPMMPETQKTEESNVIEAKTEAETE